jgi:hypothetical protein
MDIMVTAIVAISVSIMSALIAVIKRKTIGKIFIYAALALIIGLPFGYFLTPIIISFYLRSVHENITFSTAAKRIPPTNPAF